MNQLYNITFILMLTNIHNVTLANYEKKKIVRINLFILKYKIKLYTNIKKIKLKQ